MGVTQAKPAGPPKSSVSGLASGSEKFELACPARKPPRVPYAYRNRGIKLSDTVVRLFELKLPLPAKSNSMKVRDSPQAVGVRVSTLSRVSRGLWTQTPLPRELAVLFGTLFPAVRI